jgi:hypothetical protein
MIKTYSEFPPTLELSVLKVGKYIILVESFAELKCIMEQIYYERGLKHGIF